MLCFSYEFTFKHNYAGSDWNDTNIQKTLDKLITDGYLNASIIQSYTHVGVACSCDASSAVVCGFLFGSGLISKELTVDYGQPLWISTFKNKSECQSLNFDDLFNLTSL